MEVETQLQIAENLAYVEQEPSLQLRQSAAEVGKILNGLIAKISSQ